MAPIHSRNADNAASIKRLRIGPLYRTCLDLFFVFPPVIMCPLFPLQGAVDMKLKSLLFACGVTWFVGTAWGSNAVVSIKLDRESVV